MHQQPQLLDQPTNKQTYYAEQVISAHYTLRNMHSFIEILLC